MKKLLLILVPAIAVVAWWVTSDTPTRTALFGGTPAPVTATATAKPQKPVCDPATNSSTAAPIDCTPPAPKVITLDGTIDKDHARVKDWIDREWGHSPIAVAGLTVVAQQYFLAVEIGPEKLSPERIKQLVTDMVRNSACASELETQEMLEGRARKRLALQVMNTPDKGLRAAQYHQNFAVQSGHPLIEAFTGTPTEACGFDPAELARAEHTVTINDSLRAEVDDLAKKEEGKK